MSQAITAYLTSPDAAALIDFYKRAFGAVELARHMAPDGKRIMHARLNILGSELMLADDFSDMMHHPSMTPASLGGSPVTLAIVSDNADQLWEQAVAAGATVTMPYKDQFWGARYGQFTDPHGHKWSLSTPEKPMSREELDAASKSAFKPAHSGTN